MKKGNKVVKIVLVAVLAIVLIGGAILMITTLNNRRGAQQTDGGTQVQSSVSTASVATEAPKPKRKVYPIGKWDMAIPYLNPFGSQSNYLSVEYKTNQVKEFAYVNQDNIEVSRYTCGEMWQMEVSWKDQAMDAYEDLAWYLSEMPGEVYNGTSEDIRVLHAINTDNSEWWGFTQRTGEGYRLTVYKEYKLEPGKTETFNTSGYEEPKIYFMSQNTNKFQTFETTLKEGEMDVRARSEYTQGDYRRVVDFNRRFYAYKTNRYLLDNIPQESSTPVLWEVTWHKDTDPKEISFTLTEGSPISPIRYGERLGALKVKGISQGDITVSPPAHISVYHPEYDNQRNIRGDITPEGDTIFWIPSGYWNVNIDPRENEDVRSCTAKMIPVNSGEITELDIPAAVNESISSAKGTAGGSESGIKLLATKEQGDKANITFQLMDSQNPEFAPNLANTGINEGGMDTKVISVERVKTPPSIVLVLDSSGSMKGQMEQTVAAAKTFIQGLPDDAFIQVIDFDTKPTILKGTTKAEVLKGLSAIKANGATALYDSILVGLDLLKNQERPTLVVFTDGVDANGNDTGPGSKATKEEVMAAVDASGIPLFTIGFGPKHDNAVLLELAGVSDGMYYPAEDKTALDNVFTAINKKLGNTFIATYERPKEAASSDVPVITLVIDTSGSMDKDPENPICGYRIDKMKILYHDFINSIPDNSLIQLMRFSDDVTLDQVLTTRKTELLQALGELEAGGGTEILMSTASAFKALKPVASNKRIIVYLTDAALEVEEGQKDQFERILTEISEEGIQTLWVGLGVAGKDEAFAWAAQKAGGSYVISEDPQVLRKALDDALAKVQKVPAEKLSLSITVKNDSGKGSQNKYAASTLVDFPMPKSSGEVVALHTLNYKTGEKYVQYEEAAAQLVYGTDIPSKQVTLYKRLPLNATGKNQYMEWTAKEAYFFGRLRGVDAPNGKCFMAIEMDMKNIATNNTPYMIPDIASHFFINLNNEGAYPASTATWLAEEPINPPGESGIMIKPGESKHGVLIFIVPFEKTEQVSLHFYDTSYGHITLPIIGTPVKEEVALETLPTQVEGKLTDTFTMSIQGKKDLSKIESVELREDSLFRVYEGELKTKVQALFNIQPQQRFFLKIQTGAGPFMTSINNTTALMPYGFLRPVILAPASSNKIRFVYQIPASLKDTKMELYGDISGGALNLPVSGTSIIGSASAGPAYEGDAMSLQVNSLTKAQVVGGDSDYFVIADITVSDVVDGYGTFGFQNAFTLVREGYTQEQEQQAKAERAGLNNFGSGSSRNDNMLKSDAITDELLLGVDGEWIVYDGNQRRGILAFRLPRELKDEAWTLKSEFFKTLNMPVSTENYPNPDYLVREVSPRVDERFNQQLAQALKDVIAAYQSLKAASGSANAVQTMNLESSVDQKNNIPVPVSSVDGAVKLRSLKTTADFTATMTGLKWLPSPDGYDRYRSAPEAVLTQGWGTEGDLANLAGGLLAKAGYSPTFRMVQVTDKGREALKALGSVDKVDLTQLPAWSYTDDQGKARVFVVPFMKDLSELSGLVYLPGGQGRREMMPQECNVSVYYTVSLLNEGLNSAAGDAASALGGGESAPSAPREVRVLSTQMPLDLLSKDAIDIRATHVRDGYTAVLMANTEQILGDQFIDPKLYRIEKIRVEVNLSSGRFSHITTLEKGDDLSGVFYTMGINLPDLPEEAAKTLQKAADSAYKAAVKPDELSTLRWYGRSVINKFIAGQTINERNMAGQMDLTVGRTNKERVILVTMWRKNAQSNFMASIDLMQSANQIHKGTPEAVQSFNQMSGIFNSHLEGMVLPGEGNDFMDIWRKLPDDAKLFLSLWENRSEDVAYMREQGYPESIIEKVKDNRKNIIIHNKPAKINGVDRWAWLEVDPQTYETIAVLDTGEHGGFAEYLMALEPVVPNGEDYREFMVGAMIGVDVAVWSVASFSLELDDYDDILEAAKAYTYGVCEILDNFMTNVGYAKLEIGIGPAKAKIVDEEFDYMAKYFEEIKDGKTVGGGQNYLGFADGFKAGAGYYFKNAEAAAEEDDD